MRRNEPGEYTSSRMFEILKEQGGTLTLLANQSGTDLGQLSHMRKGNRPIPRRVVEAAVRILNMPEEELFSDATPKAEEKFWSYVTPAGNGCWLWGGYVSKDGTSFCYYLGERRKAAEVAWELTNQPLPSAARLISFCKTHGCINPDHCDLEPIFSDTELFWSLTDVLGDDECWLWGGAKISNGYGRLPRVGNRYAHRFSYELANGPIPKGRWILHHCDNPSCVNPKHLYAGTAKDNAQDRERRGRGGGPKFQGELSPNAKLTEPQVREIRRLKGVIPASKLAPRYGVTPAAIYSIQGGYSWKHLSEEQVPA